MLGGKFNLANLLKNAKQMQELVERTQTELAHTEVNGEAGAGAVKITMTAKYVVTQVSIDDAILKEQKNILEELIAAAINDATQKINHIVQDKMASASQLFGNTDSE